MSNKHTNFLICLTLVFITLSAYWPVKNFPFIKFDDGIYVTKNHHVQQGLTLENIILAFTPASSIHEEKTYWHPVTWLSHMTDCQLFGLDAGYHHLTSLFIHILSVIILFLFLARMTGTVWESAFAAALFAIHPINVDSVAWIAERKNILSTFFWILTMLAYVFYAKRPSISRYTLMLLSFTLGLLSKPMLVTLPFALLLLDFWPLCRIRWGQEKAIVANNTLSFSHNSLSRLIIEKLPLLALSGAVIWLSMISLRSQAQILDAAITPMPLRIGNAIVSYSVYIGKLFWPSHLAIFYPYPTSIPLWKVLCSTAGLISITFFVLKKAKKSPYLVVGWFWFTGTLVPVSGIIQGGLWPALADRWAYVPMIGMFIVISWGVPEIISRMKIRKRIPALCIVAVIIIFIILTRIQLGYWQNTRTLFKHDLDVTKNNYFALSIMGNYLARDGEKKEAEKYFKKAIDTNPQYGKAFYNMGLLLADEERHTEALKYYFNALMLSPGDADFMRDIARSLLQTGKTDEAISYCKKSLGIKPDSAETHNNLGAALFYKGRIAEAIKEYEKAIQLKPDYADAYYNLGNAFERQRNTDKAIAFYLKALKADRNCAKADKSIGDIMFMQKKNKLAFYHYSKALQSDPDDAKTHYNIGVVLYQQGHFKEALGHFKKAVEINPDYKKAETALALTAEAMQKEGRER
ncbi:MAG: tetratricopeptide repeat protein [Dissulfuribacterales bacterium]